MSFLHCLYLYQELNRGSVTQLVVGEREIYLEWEALHKRLITLHYQGLVDWHIF